MSAREPVGSRPGVERLSVDLLGEAARRARDLGIPCLALFPNTPRELRTDAGREALNPDNLMCRAIKAIKDAEPDIRVLTDVALPPYTTHGNAALLTAHCYVLNDTTMALLVRKGLGQP